MSQIADIDGIGVADNQTPVEECGCLIDNLKKRPGPFPKRDPPFTVTFDVVNNEGR